MMKMQIGTTATTPGDGELELRPGGMVVQKRTDQISNVPRVIRVRVKYGSVHHEISINSQSSFGELKKKLSGATGVHHQDMKIIYKDKERDPKMFLDLSGVKDRSKLVLKDDPISQEKRLLELRKISLHDKSTRAFSDITFQVQKLAGQLSAFDTVIGKGGNVEEKNLENLMDMLMNQLVKLDSISGDGDFKLKKKIQEERLQKYVEVLDLLKIKNSTQPQPQMQPKPQTQPQYKKQGLLTFDEQVPRKPIASSSSPSVIITTRWETFDSHSTSAATAQTVKPVQPNHKFN
ncbi:PREDICTED: BAG family molecular chaperone regulator 2-like isoform X4 [Camelina sativa]|uniref:BAG family molecular chaperone regulator 2-like isoform X4 n=1 Tax=Camelina sativa TaxID=90675 RepID=A0ABM0XCL3_CAMSA|nr:PREDICTED: BAG family molecular chaperone regulator 2-like isoform X4 [Camelina sativa]